MWFKKRKVEKVEKALSKLQPLCEDSVSLCIKDGNTLVLTFLEDCVIWKGQHLNVVLELGSPRLNNGKIYPPGDE
jgi:hypothetical protein